MIKIYTLGATGHMSRILFPLNLDGNGWLTTTDFLYGKNFFTI